MAIDPKTVALALSSLDVKAAEEAMDDNGHEHERLPFSLLYSVASAKIPHMPDNFHERLKIDEKGKETFIGLLDRLSKYRLPPAAAAASGSVSRREDGNIVMSLVPARSREGQVYVLFEIRSPTAKAPTTLSVLAPDGYFDRRTLPQFEGGVSQLVLETDDAMLQALRDPETELFIA